MNSYMIWLTNIFYVLDLQKNLFYVSNFDQQERRIFIKNQKY